MKQRLAVWVAVAVLMPMAVAQSCGSESSGRDHPEQRGIPLPSLPEASREVADRPASRDRSAHVVALEQFWAREFMAAGSQQYRELRGEVGPAGSTGSGCPTPQESSWVLYCAVDDSVRWSPGLEEKLASAGPEAFMVVLAHEWGHVVQGRGLPVSGLGVERQADCLAGAYFKGDRSGAGDVANLPAQFRAALGVFGPAVSSGDARRRGEAFALGLRHGVAGCVGA